MPTTAVNMSSISGSEDEDEQAEKDSSQDGMSGASARSRQGSPRVHVTLPGGSGQVAVWNVLLSAGEVVAFQCRMDSALQQDSGVDVCGTYDAFLLIFLNCLLTWVESVLSDTNGS